MMQKFSAPLRVRKQPEIFCFTSGIRIARSPRLFVQGTRRSVTKRSTSSACSRIRRSRLIAGVGLMRPRRALSRFASGNKTGAKRYWQQSIELYKQLQSPIAKTVQGELDRL